MESIRRFIAYVALVVWGIVGIAMFYAGVLLFIENLHDILSRDIVTIVIVFALSLAIFVIYLILGYLSLQIILPFTTKEGVRYKDF
jgi:divalent metal cation (Fe/Co/Zn/Cd) transporter